jgi:hypothetical protein
MCNSEVDKNIKGNTFTSPGTVFKVVEDCERQSHRPGSGMNSRKTPRSGTTIPDSADTEPGNPDAFAPEPE